MEDPKKVKEGIENDIRNYSRLERINESDEFKDFFNLQIDTVVQKMLSCFTGNGPKDWDEFCKVRGEVIAYLYPIQQVRGAKIMKAQLKENLNAYYNTAPE